MQETANLKLKKIELQDSPPDITVINPNWDKVDTEITGMKSQKADKTYVDQKVADIVNSAPEALDTLKELSTALGNDPNFATTVSTQIGQKVDKVSGKGLSTNDFTTAEKNKLAGVATNANNYVHPNDANTRHITDVERNTWGKGIVQTWESQVKCGIWSRLYHMYGGAIGDSSFVNIMGTRGNVIYNAMFLITNSHAGGNTTNIIQLSGSEYSVFDIRAVASKNGDYYLEMKDTDPNYAENGKLQAIHVRLLDMSQKTLTKYTSFTDGTTIPSTHVEQSKFTVLKGKNTNANALTATKLFTPRTINGVTFDGSANITLPNATQSAHGLMSNTDKTKLDGIATGANNYVHPNDAGTRHVTDAEKTNWNGKLDKSGGDISGNLKITKDTPVLTLNTTASGEQKGGAVVFAGDRQDVELKHIWYDSAQPDNLGYGLKIQKGSENAEPSKAKLMVEGEIYADNNKKVYHTGNKPTSSDIGALNTNVIPITHGQDLNNLRELGAYGSPVTNICSSLLNKPTDMIAGEMRLDVVSCGNSSHLMQVLTSKNGVSVRRHYRVSNNTTWGVWIKIYDSSNKPTKADVGLSAVDNTSDANKPISTATQTALNGKAPISHVTDMTAHITEAERISWDSKANGVHEHTSIASRGRVDCETNSAPIAIKGLSMSEAYPRTGDSGVYPFGYGNILNMKDSNNDPNGGCNQLFLGWNTSSTTSSGLHAGAWIRSKRDVGGIQWSPWAQIYTTAFKPTKADVGLSNVPNYLLATQAQAQAGTDNASFMTPLRVKEAIGSIQPASHAHSYLPLSGGTITGTIKKFGSNIDHDVLHFGHTEIDDTTSWKLSYKGSTSGDDGNEFQIKSTSGKSFDFDHLGNMEFVNGSTRSKFYSTLNKPTASEIGASPTEGSTSLGTLAQDVTLGGGSVMSITQNDGAWWQKIHTADNADKAVHRFLFSERQGSGDYVELFGVDGNGEIFSKGRKVYHTGNKPTATDVGALATTGGMLTGNLQVGVVSSPNVHIGTGASTGVHIKFRATGVEGTLGWRESDDKFTFKNTDNTTFVPIVASNIEATGHLSVGDNKAQMKYNATTESLDFIFV